MASLEKMTKAQDRLLNILCDNAEALGRVWYEKNKHKYEDDPYKGWRYLRDKYIKEHNIHQEAVDMMSDSDKAKYMQWYESMDEVSKHTMRYGVAVDSFFIDEINEWAD